MRKLFLAIAALTGLATTTFAAEYNAKDVQANVSTPLFQNRTVKDQNVVKTALEYLGTVQTVNDGQTLGVIRYKVIAYDQTTGTDNSLAGLKKYADGLLASEKFEKPVSGANYVGIFSLWWRSSEPKFAQNVYDLMKATPGYEAFGDAGLWANAVGKYTEAYELYMASGWWPQRAMDIAVNKLDDPVKALAAAKLITTKTYSATIVKEVVRMTVSKLVGNDAVNSVEMKTFLQNVNRKYSAQLILDKPTWEPIIAQIRTVLETY